MGEMSKSPEEIKKGLECCGKEADTCDGCPYKIEFSAECLDDIHEDDLAYIQRLERERDALLEDIKKAAICLCFVCKKYRQFGAKGIDDAECTEIGRFADHDLHGALACGMFEWRGVPEKEATEWE